MFSLTVILFLVQYQPNAQLFYYSKTCSYEEYPQIPVEIFSQSLKIAFTNEGVKYQLTTAQEKIVLDKLASSTVW